jgi:D-glycero-D-manno-heptose 1,7-bisphosphate phosphatase
VQNTKKNKIAFLDRDGVVNVDHGHVHSIEKFKLCKNFLNGARHLMKEGFKLVIITNQAGIAKSYYTEETFINFSHWIYNYLKDEDVLISSTYYCPHHPNFSGECTCRKPKPQMILKALDDYNTSPDDCLLIGDKISDMKAAITAEIRRVYKLVDTSVLISRSLYPEGNWENFIDQSKKNTFKFI